MTSLVVRGSKPVSHAPKVPVLSNLYLGWVEYPAWGEWRETLRGGSSNQGVVGRKSVTLKFTVTVLDCSWDHLTWTELSIFYLPEPTFFNFHLETMPSRGLFSFLSRFYFFLSPFSSFSSNTTIISFPTLISSTSSTTVTSIEATLTAASCTAAFSPTAYSAEVPSSSTAVSSTAAYSTAAGAFSLELFRRSFLIGAFSRPELFGDSNQQPAFLQEQLGQGSQGGQGDADGEEGRREE